MKLIFRLGMGTFLLSPFAVLAQGIGYAIPPIGAPTGGLVPSIMNIVNGLLVIVGIAAAIYLIIGGVRYITSQGDEGQTEQAKNTILYALIGLIVIGLAAAIVNFVINTVAVA